MTYAIYTDSSINATWLIHLNCIHEPSLESTPYAYVFTLHLTVLTHSVTFSCVIITPSLYSVMTAHSSANCPYVLIPCALQPLAAQMSGEDLLQLIYKDKLTLENGKALQVHINYRKESGGYFTPLMNAIWFNFVVAGYPISI